MLRHLHLLRRAGESGLVLAALAGGAAAEPPPYTTRGGKIVHRTTGEEVLLQGFGIGGWLLPEGYMWGIRTLDRPRQFEQAVADLVGEDDAREFWRLYHASFLTEDDVRAMKAFGADSIRIALLASRLQPRRGQPEKPPFVYSEDGFRWLDRVVEWAGRHDVGVIWDMHGAPGAQNAENIADSDGEARLWTEPEVYWPRLEELWVKIAERYAGNPAILGYDLLNEPLLARYEGVDPALLRKLYVRLTAAIRTVDPHGLIFVEGDDWAQNFEALEPLDWDPHLVLAFHTYPPTSTAEGLERWAKLRREHRLPLWHGETGEQSAPFDLNRRATAFLNGAGVGWSWWTHKKIARRTQPWVCPPTRGFRRVLDYWQGRGERPSRDEAREWLFEQARRTHTSYCDFLPDMVRSLEPFSPDAYLASLPVTAPEIYDEPLDAEVTVGTAAVFEARALGHPLAWQWFRDGEPLAGETASVLTVVPRSAGEGGSRYHAVAETPKGRAESRKARLTVGPFAGPDVPRAGRAPALDGRAEPLWDAAAVHPLRRLVVQRDRPPAPGDFSASFRALWDDDNLYLLIEVRDDVLVDTDPRSYHNDGVEVFLDLSNSKAAAYGDGHFQLRAIRGREGVEAERGVLDRSSGAGPGIRAGQAETEGGYAVEMALAWEALGGRGGSFLGLDVHVNDNDLDRREDKLAWWASEDEAHLRPSIFGTARLVDPPK